MSIAFGTDGIRGPVGVSPMTEPEMIQIGRAIGAVLANENKIIVIGKDTRESGEMVQAALEIGLAEFDVNIIDLGTIPTPAIAYLTKYYQACAGIVISASHNPYQDNGIKIFNHQAQKLSDDKQQAIENFLAKPTIKNNININVNVNTKLQKTDKSIEAEQVYLDYCMNTAAHLNLSDLSIVLDCANGAMFHIAPKVFSQLGAKLHCIATEPDGKNINNHCGSTHLDNLQQQVISQQADLGIAFDGDGDRVMMVDHKANIIDGDKLLYIMAQAELAKGTSLKGVVGTVMSNIGLEFAIKKQNLDFCRSKVGDRYVLEKLKEKQYLLGGESSGHLIHLGHSTTGDGLVAALQVLQAITQLNKSLFDLANLIQCHPQCLLNVQTKQKATITSNPSVESAIAAAEAELGEQGRVLIRPSGTEPVVRVMIEAKDKVLAQKLATSIANAIKNLEQ